MRQQERDTERDRRRDRATKTPLKGKYPTKRHTEGSQGCLGRRGGMSPTCSHLKALSPALGDPVATQLTGGSWCPGCLSPQGPEASNIPCRVPLQFCRSREATGCPGSPGPTRSWPVQVPLNFQVLVLYIGLLEHLVRGQSHGGCGIGTWGGDCQGGPYQAVADQLGLQPPQSPQDDVSVGSEGPQDLLQGCPGLRLTLLCQPLTKCQQCIYTLSCSTEVCL